MAHKWTQAQKDALSRKMRKLNGKKSATVVVPRATSLLRVSRTASKRPAKKPTFGEQTAPSLHRMATLIRTLPDEMLVRNYRIA